jgi:predicted DNA-binding protein YlxM (UPF0122 family)
MSMNKNVRKEIKKYYYDYWITNIITGIHYIGSHAGVKIPVSGYGNSFSKEECNYMGSSRPLREDIKKYGKENFYKHIIEVYPTDPECRAEEGKLHELYDVDNNLLFYNLVRAGKVGFSNSGENHHGFGDIDYEGISCSDPKLYRTLRRENLTNFDDLELLIPLPEEPLSWIKKDVLTPEEEFDKVDLTTLVDSVYDTILTPSFQVSRRSKPKNIKRFTYYLRQYYSEGREQKDIAKEFNVTTQSIQDANKKTINTLSYVLKNQKLRSDWEDYSNQTSISDGASGYSSKPKKYFLSLEYRLTHKEIELQEWVKDTNKKIFQKIVSEKGSIEVITDLIVNWMIQTVQDQNSWKVDNTESTLIHIWRGKRTKKGIYEDGTRKFRKGKCFYCYSRYEKSLEEDSYYHSWDHPKGSYYRSQYHKITKQRDGSTYHHK